MVENNENNGLQNTVTPVPETPATPVTPVAPEVPFTPRAIETPVSATPVETPAPVEPVTEPAPIVPDPVAPVEVVAEPVAPAPVETPVAETPVAETPVTSEVTTEPAAMSNEAVMNTATVGEVPTEPTTAPVEGSAEALPEEPKKKSGALKVILIILVLAAIAGGVIYYLATKKTPTPVEEPDPDIPTKVEAGNQGTTVDNFSFRLDKAYLPKKVDGVQTYYNETLGIIVYMKIHNGFTYDQVKTAKEDLKSSIAALGHTNVTYTAKEVASKNALVYEGTIEGKTAYTYFVEYEPEIIIEIYGVSTTLDKDALVYELEKIVVTAEKVKNEKIVPPKTDDNGNIILEKFTMGLTKSIYKGLLPEETTEETEDNTPILDINPGEQTVEETNTETNTETTTETTTEETQTEPEVTE